MIAIVSTAVALVACGSDLPPLAGGSINGSGNQVAGGPCTTEGAKQSCHAIVLQHQGFVDCFNGTQQCVNGAWTPCDGSDGSGGTLSTHAIPILDPDQLRLASLSSPSNTTPPCSTDLCNPYCWGFNEVPPSPIGPTCPAPKGWGSCLEPLDWSAYYKALPSGNQEANGAFPTTCTIVGSGPDPCEFGLQCSVTSGTGVCQPRAWGSTNAANCGGSGSGDDDDDDDSTISPDFTLGMPCYDAVSTNFAISICNHGTGNAPKTGTLNIAHGNGSANVNPTTGTPTNGLQGGCAIDLSAATTTLKKGQCMTIEPVSDPRCGTQGSSTWTSKNNSGDQWFLVNWSDATGSMVGPAITECDTSNNFTATKDTAKTAADFCVTCGSGTTATTVTTPAGNGNLSTSQLDQLVMDNTRVWASGCSQWPTADDAKSNQFTACGADMYCAISDRPTPNGGDDKCHQFGQSGNATTWSSSICSGFPDLTVGVGCADASATPANDPAVPICNRGNVAVAAGATIKMTLFKGTTAKSPYAFDSAIAGATAGECTGTAGQSKSFTDASGKVTGTCLDLPATSVKMPTSPAAVPASSWPYTCPSAASIAAAAPTGVGATVSATCSITLAAGLAAGACTMIHNTADCAGNLNTTGTLLINSDNAIPECDLYGQDDEQIATTTAWPGCSNNWSAYTKPGTALPACVVTAGTSSPPPLPTPSPTPKPTTYSNTYTMAPCPNGYIGQWDALGYNATIPTGADVKFAIQTGPNATAAGPGPWNPTTGTPAGILVADAPVNHPAVCTVTGPSPCGNNCPSGTSCPASCTCPVDLGKPLTTAPYTVRDAQQQQLQLNVLLTPAAGASCAGVLSPGLVALPGGISACPGAKNIQGSTCTGATDYTSCDQDFHCDPTTNTCLYNLNPPWIDPNCKVGGVAGFDLTIEPACTDAAGNNAQVPICNRGGATIPAGQVIVITQTNFSSTCAKACAGPGSADCSYTLPAALKAGSCIDIPASAGCSLGSGNHCLQINPGNTVVDVNGNKECNTIVNGATWPVNGTGAGCNNNDTYVKNTPAGCQGAAACAAPLSPPATLNSWQVTYSCIPNE
jgi:hypothetical protein